MGERQGLVVLAVLAGILQHVGAQNKEGSLNGGSQGSSSRSSGSSSEEEEGSGRSLELANNLLVALAIFAFVIFVFRAILYSVQYLRHLTCLSNNTQRYFTVPNSTWAAIKSNVLYAPLFRVRHNNEFRLSSAINMGVLPTRFQTLLMVAIIATNAVLCVHKLPWNGERAELLDQLLKRSGTLATVNLIPLVLMTGRNNPLITLLNVPFDSFNMMHRLFARMVTLEAIVHTVCWTIDKVQKAGWKGVSSSLQRGVHGRAVTGTVGMALLIALVTLSSSPLRHAFYETFLHLHIAMVVVAFAFLWIHLKERREQMYLLAAIALWALERSIRLFTLLYRNIGNGGTRATIEALPGDAMRVTFKVARPWNFKPGQHFYVMIPSVGFWTSHPFSVAWADNTDLLSSSSRSSMSDEKGLVMTRQDLTPLGPSTFSAVIRRRTGFTDALWRKAEKAGAYNGASLTLSAFVSGPYGLAHSLSSYGTVMLFAAGVGITHQVPYVRHLVEGHANGAVATRKVVLVWIIQSPEHLEWIRPWMTQILGMERRRDVLSIKLFITRPRSAKEVHSPSATVQMYPGRPGIDTLIGKECENQVGAMGISVCGTGSLQDEVRRVCRERGKWNNIDFIEESFTW